MKYKISYKILTTLALIVLIVFLFYRPKCTNTNTEIIIVQEIQPQQPPQYFGPATIPPPAFPLFGIPTRPLRELGGWRVNYGV